MPQPKAVKYVILADVHANIEALDAVIDSLADDERENIIFLGDAVGYNAAPLECLERIQDLGATCIAGNHDKYCRGEDCRGVREALLPVVEWTMETVGENEFLRSLPETAMVDNHYLAVHGSPRDPDEYIISGSILRENMAYMSEQYGGIEVCFFGHSHIPVLAGPGKVITNLKEGRTELLKRFSTYLINPGSVGQPRDGSPEAAYAVFDAEKWEISFRRVAYDVKAAQERIAAADLPRELGQRLEVGK